MKVDFFILDADYEQSKKESFVRIFGVTEEGKTVGVSLPCQPYFYVLPKEPDLAEKEIREVLKDKIKIRKIEREEKFFEESKKTFLKIFCYIPQDVQKIRDIVKQLEEKRGGSGSVVEEYEYSINLYRRFLLDRNIPGSCWVEVEGEREKSDMKVDFFIKGENIKPVERLIYPPLRMLSFDIETYEGVKEKKIIMISLWTDKFHKVITYQKSDYPEWVEVVEDEKSLLERFFEILDEYDPDVIFSYNGDAFDFPVIQERASKNKVELLLSRDAKKMRFTRRARVSSAKIKGRVHIDVYNFVNNILAPNLQTETLTLDAVAGELLGDEKIEMDYQELLESWRKSKNLEKLASYSLKDAQLTFDLGVLLLPQMLELSSTVGQLLFDTCRMTYGQLAEWFLTQKAVEQNRIIPNQPKWEEIQKRRTFTYTGGFVKEPVGGVHENIAVLDFRSLYPSIIATFNISPETLNCSCHKGKGYKVPETDYWFCSGKKGFVSGVIEELITRRAKLKKELSTLPQDSPEYRILNNRQNSLKIVANATYGMFAFAGAKWYCRECAESCTSFGRFFINQVIKEAEGKNFTVLYADTDSCFVKKPEAKENFNKQVEEFLEEVNSKLPGILELELQGFYKRGIFIPKEAAPGAAKKRYALIDHASNLLIRGLESVRRDWCQLAKQVQRKVLTYILEGEKVDEAVLYVREVVKKLRKKEIPLKDLVIYEQLAKPLYSYKQKGPHVVVAQKMVKRGREVSQGMLIMFVITKGEGSISERAEPVEDVKIEDVDENYYIENQIIPASLRVLTVLGVSKERLLGESLF